MLKDTPDLGDDLTLWDDKFKTEIHGVIVVCANSKLVLQNSLDKIKGIFRVDRRDATIEEVTLLAGHTRPGAESGHEQQALLYVTISF